MRDTHTGWLLWKVLSKNTKCVGIVQSFMSKRINTPAEVDPLSLFSCEEVEDDNDWRIGREGWRSTEAPRRAPARCTYRARLTVNARGDRRAATHACPTARVRCVYTRIERGSMDSMTVKHRRTYTIITINDATRGLFQVHDVDGFSFSFLHGFTLLRRYCARYFFFLLHFSVL